MKKEVLPDFYFYGGKIMSLNYINNYTKSISIHTLDYDNYLIHQKTKYKNNLYNDNHIVFLDEYLPFHPDHEFQGSEIACSAEYYYSILENCLEIISNFYNLPIVMRLIRVQIMKNILNYSKNTK